MGTERDDDGTRPTDSVDLAQAKALADIVPIARKRVGMSAGGELHADADDVEVLRQLVKQAVEERAESVSRIDMLERALRSALGTEWLPGGEDDLLALCVERSNRVDDYTRALTEALGTEPHGRINVIEDCRRFRAGVEAVSVGLTRLTDEHAQLLASRLRRVLAGATQ